MVDWTHPLARGLIAAYLPSQGLRNLAGLGADLAFGSAANFRASAHGIVVPGTAANEGANSGALPSTMRPTSSASIFWAGSVTAGTFNTTMLGLEHNNSNSNPWMSAVLFSAGAGTVTLGYNVSGSYSEIGGAYLDTSGAFATYAGTLEMGGAATVYFNGAQAASQAVGAGSIQYDATAEVDFCAFAADPSRTLNGVGVVGCIWSRALSASEVAALHFSPFSLFVPVG